MSLTLKDAQTFCSNILKMKPGLVEDYPSRLDFLEEYVKNFHFTCPFTNMWDALTTQLWKPEFNGDTMLNRTNRLHCINLVLSGQGGTCEFNTLTSKLVLMKLGFDVKHILAVTRNRPGLEMIHSINIVCNVLSHGDVYMLDVGSRIAPIFQPVPLHQLQHDSDEIYLGSSGHVENKLSVKIDADDGYKLYRRYFRYLHGVLPAATSDWTLFYEFDDVDVSFLYSGDYAEIDYSLVFNLNETKFFKRLEFLLLAHQKSDNFVDNFWSSNMIISGFPHGKPALFTNNKAMIQTSENSSVLDHFEYKDAEELIQAVQTWYPRLNAHYLRIWLQEFWRKKYQYQAPNSKL